MLSLKLMSYFLASSACAYACDKTWAPEKFLAPTVSDVAAPAGTVRSASVIATPTAPTSTATGRIPLRRGDCFIAGPFRSATGAGMPGRVEP